MLQYFKFAKFNIVYKLLLCCEWRTNRLFKTNCECQKSSTFLTLIGVAPEAIIHTNK